jgi:predicted nucleic acid-binding Zn ribbon protein
VPIRNYNIRKPIETNLRQKLLEHQNYRCFYCDTELYGQSFVADHAIPWVSCRNNKKENLVAACVRCNQIKYDKVFNDVEEARAYILERRGISQTNASPGQPMSFTRKLCIVCGDVVPSGKRKRILCSKRCVKRRIFNQQRNKRQADLPIPFNTLLNGKPV